MSQEWDGGPLEDLISQDATLQDEGMSVWSFLEHMNAGRLLRVNSAEAFSLALDEVFLEMYHNVLKRVSFCFRLSLFASLFFSAPEFCPSSPGLHVEKGARAQELDWALVRAEALVHGLLRQRGVETQERGDPAGSELCGRGGRGTMWLWYLIYFHFVIALFFCFSLFRTGKGNAACSASKPTIKPLR